MWYLFSYDKTTSAAHPGRVLLVFIIMAAFGSGSWWLYGARWHELQHLAACLAKRQRLMQSMSAPLSRVQRRKLIHACARAANVQVRLCVHDTVLHAHGKYQAVAFAVWLLVRRGVVVTTVQMHEQGDQVWCRLGVRS